MISLLDGLQCAYNSSMKKKTPLELEKENRELKEKINNAINCINWHYDLGTKEDIAFCWLRDNLLEILGDKE